MAEDLGVAVLRVTADTREALGALEVLRNAVSRGIGDNGNFFKGLEQQAEQSAQNITRILRAAGSTSNLRFENISEALQFDPRNTVAGLQEYRNALRALFQQSELGNVATQALVDRISALDGAIRRASTTTAQWNAQQRQSNADLERGVQLREAQANAEAAAAREVEIRRGRAIGALNSASITGQRPGGGFEAGSPSDPSNPVKLLRQQLDALRNIRININSSSLEQFGSTAKLAYTDTLAFTRAVINGERALANNRAGLVQQSQAFKELAANTKIGTAEFTNFIQAAAKAQQKNLFSGFAEITALRKLFDLGKVGSKDSFKGSDDLLKYAKNVEQVPAAINLYIQALEEAKNVSDISKGSFQALTTEIARQKQALDAATQAAEQNASVQLMSAEQRKAVAQSFIQASQAKTQLALPSSQLLQQRIGQTESPAPVRLRTDELNRYQGAIVTLTGAFGVLKTNNDSFTVSVEDERRRIDAAAQGALDFANDLKRLGLTEEQLKQSVINTSNAYRDREQVIAAAASAQERAAQQAIAAEDARQRAIGEFNASPISGRLPNGQTIGGSPAAKRDLAVLSQQQLDEERKRLDDARKSRQKVSDKVGSAVGSGVIGGAFPLLFGQGVGASLGGGIGGIAGGAIGGQFGFGLSLVGTAVGQAFDQMIQKGRDLADALTDPIGKFDQLKQAGLISTKGLETTISALIASGRQAEAYALIQQDAARFNGTGDLKSLNDAFDTLKRRFAELGIAVAQFTAGPLTEFLRKVTAVLQAPTVQQRFEDNQKKLTPEQQKNAEALARTQYPALKASGLTDFQAAVAAKQQAIRYQEAVMGASANQLKTQTQLNQARERYNELGSIAFRQIDAQAQGNKQLANELQRQKIILESRDKLLVAPDEVSKQKIYRDTALELYQLAAKEKNERLEMWNNAAASASRVKSMQEQVAIERAAGGGDTAKLTSLGKGVLSDVAAYRQTERETALAQIRAAQKPSDDQLQNSAKEARANLIRAGEELKNKLADSFKSAQDAVRNISRSVEDAVLALQQAQNTRGQGVNEFLSAQQVTDRQQQIARDQAPVLQQLVQEFARRTGIQPNFTLSGNLEQVNAARSRAISAFRGELRSTDDIQRQQRELERARADEQVARNAKNEFDRKFYQAQADNRKAALGGDSVQTMAAVASATIDLTSINKDLKESINGLASKDWNVYIQLPNNATVPVALGS